MSTGGFSGVTNDGQGAFTQEEARQIAEENERNVKAGLQISNKFPHDQQHGKRYSFTLHDGKIYLKNGIRYANFVIDENGQLHLGNGHSFLANGRSVIAAGTIKVDRHGNIRRILNNSGHYQPTVVETTRFPAAFRKIGLNVDNAWLSIYRFTRTKSGYVGKRTLVFHGQVKYLGRRVR